MEVVNNEVLRRNGIIGHLKELRPIALLSFFKGGWGYVFFFFFPFWCSMGDA
jgi:hypothetical protein